MAPLEAFNGLLPPIGKKLLVSSFYADFAKKEHTAQLHGWSTGDGLRGLVKERSYYDVDRVFPFVAAIIDGSLGFEEKFDLSQMNVSYTETVS